MCYIHHECQKLDFHLYRIYSKKHPDTDNLGHNIWNAWWQTEIPLPPTVKVGSVSPRIFPIKQHWYLGEGEAGGGKNKPFFIFGWGVPIYYDQDCLCEGLFYYIFYISKFINFGIPDVADTSKLVLSSRMGSSDDVSKFWVCAHHCEWMCMSVREGLRTIFSMKK